MIPWLDGSLQFPELRLALQEPNGLLAAGGDLSPQRVLAAYASGIFPWLYTTLNEFSKFYKMIVVRKVQTFLFDAIDLDHHLYSQHLFSCLGVVLDAS